MSVWTYLIRQLNQAGLVLQSGTAQPLVALPSVDWTPPFLLRRR